jgi:hypothetical protein
VVAGALEDIGLLELMVKLQIHVEEHLANEVEVGESYGSNLRLGLIDRESIVYIHLTSDQSNNS